MSASVEAPRLVVVMGVTGCGKSAVGEALAARLKAPFLEGDQFHPAANIEKMSSGQALTDADRWPWLAAIGQAMGETPGPWVVGACSALRRAYREALSAAAGEPVLFAHLDGTKALIAARLRERPHHFMPASLLDSQFATLEPPGADELALRVGIDRPLEAIVEEIHQALG